MIIFFFDNLFIKSKTIYINIYEYRFILIKQINFFKKDKFKQNNKIYFDSIMI